MGLKLDMAFDQAVLQGVPFTGVQVFRVCALRISGKEGHFQGTTHHLIMNSSMCHSIALAQQYKYYAIATLLLPMSLLSQGQSSYPAEVRKCNFSLFFSAKGVVKSGVKFW